MYLYVFICICRSTLIPWTKFYCISAKWISDSTFLRITEREWCCEAICCVNIMRDEIFLLKFHNYASIYHHIDIWFLLFMIFISLKCLSPGYRPKTWSEIYFHRGVIFFLMMQFVNYPQWRNFFYFSTLFQVFVPFIISHCSFCYFLSSLLLLLFLLNSVLF